MPNEGFGHQLQVFEQCEYVPTENHPVYIAWKEEHDEDVAKYQVKDIDLIPVIDNTIYLSRYNSSKLPFLFSMNNILTRQLTLSLQWNPSGSGSC